jgi:hypothetical protein
MTEQSFETRLARDIVTLADSEIGPFDPRAIAEAAVTLRPGGPAGTLGIFHRRRWVLPVLVAILLAALIVATLVIGGRPTTLPAPDAIPALVIESTGSMATARSGHAAALMSDGQVLVTGGWDGWPRAAGDRKCVSCGMNDTAEIYDPATGAFRATGHPAIAREYQSATPLATGDVLIVGGRDGNGNVFDRSELYALASDGFVAAGALRVARERHLAVALPDGRVLVVGGATDVSDTSTTGVPEAYDPVSGRWTSGEASDSLADAAAATVLPTGEVLVLDGVVSVFPDAVNSRGVATFDPGTMTARDLAPVQGASLDGPIFGSVRGAAVAENGTVVFALRDERNQGTWPGDDSGVYALDPVSGLVEVVAKGIGRPIVGPVRLTDRRLVVLTDDSAQCGPVTAWVIGPARDQAVSLARVPAIGTCNGLPGATLTALADDRLLIAGGNDSGGVTTTVASLIHPAP